MWVILDRFNQVGVNFDQIQSAGFKFIDEKQEPNFTIRSVIKKIRLQNKFYLEFLC